MEYKPRRKLTGEFKLEAVRQVALSEKPKAQLARERRPIINSNSFVVIHDRSVEIPTVCVRVALIHPILGTRLRPHLRQA